jgi:uncharacterized protein (TIGR03643 family)
MALHLDSKPVTGGLFQGISSEPLGRFFDVLRGRVVVPLSRAREYPVKVLRLREFVRIQVLLQRATVPMRPPASSSTNQPVALSESSISRIVEMAWEDRTAFEAIEAQFGLNESAVIDLMRRHMKPSSFRMWRKRMAGRRTKHAVLRGTVFLRHRASHTRQ